jgi:hypothetical protein
MNSLVTETRRRNAAFKFSEKAYLIFSCCQLPFCEFPKHTTALHYGYDTQMYCTFVPFCKPTFSGATREWDALYIEIERNTL